jgi:hypothetical protein
MTQTMTGTEQLAALVTAKQHVLKVLVQLSQRQVEFISAGDMSSLIKLLAGKQTVMNQLQAIEREMTPFRDEDPETRLWSSPAQRMACQTRAQECNTLLGQAMQLEQQAEAAMLVRRNATAEALSAVQTASDARAAYSGHTAASMNSLQVEG